MMTIMVVLAIAAAISGCAQDVTESDEYQSLEAELADVQARYDEAVAEAQEVANAEPANVSVSARRERSLAVMTEITAILDDPASFGTENEIADLLGTHATDGAVMDDDVFGAVNYRDAFYYTLFGGAVDAQITVYDMWLSDDGTQGGFLWMWSGTNSAGNPFELAGISLTEFAEDGRVSYELVTYPYSDEYVRQAVRGEGTPTPSTS
jgi:hypothetical protein